MNRLLLLSTAAALCTGAAQAAPTALKLHLADGSTVGYILNQKPRITFGADDMTVTTADATAAYRRDEIESMSFAEAPSTGIGDIREYPGGVLRFTGSEIAAHGAAIEVYTTGGYLAASGYGTISTTSLAPGLYIVRAGSQSLKITVR